MLRSITDKKFNQVCILEEIKAVRKWLKDLDYLVVIDQNLQVEGIITMKDVQHLRQGSIIECDIRKPEINVNDSILSAWNMMKSSGSDFLPVYDEEGFVGVVSLKMITHKLMDTLHEYHMLHRQMLQHLRAPLVNLQGLVSILWETPLCEENKQALSYCDESCYQAIKVIKESEHLVLFE